MEDVESLGTVLDDSDDEVLMSGLESSITTKARGRRSHLRKEQLSQGVLSHVLQSLGRIVYEEVW
jgi:hypothetical protein